MASRSKKKTKKKVTGKNLGGRPRVLNDADKRESLVRVLTTASELSELKAAARYAGMTMSTWVRGVALEQARALTAEKEAARERREQ